MPKITKIQAKKRVYKKHPHEADSKYFLKIVMYLIISSQWIRIEFGSSSVPIPVGAILAIFFAMHDHFQIDRKIEFALILVGMFVAFWLPIGV